MDKGDVLWLLENYARIAAFDQWRLKVESKAPEVLLREIERSAESAVGAVQVEDERFGQINRYQESDEIGVWWTLDGLVYENEIGMWIEVWLPRKNLRWLDPASRDDAPRLGLYAYGGKGKEAKENARKWIERARSAIRTNPKGARKPNEDDDGGFLCAFERLLFDEFVTTSDKIHPDKIHEELTPIFTEFTQHVLPSLRAARKPIQLFMRATVKRSAR